MNALWLRRVNGVILPQDRPREQALVALALGAGWRDSELTAAKVGDVTSGDDRGDYRRATASTAKGFAFLAVDDSDGMVNVVVSLDVYAKYRIAIHTASVLIEGVVQKDHKAINVVAKKISAISSI